MAGHRNPEGFAVERTPDSMDELVFANERDLTGERLNREIFLLRQVADALDRIATGDYGICLEWEEAISVSGSPPCRGQLCACPVKKPRIVDT